MTLPTLIAGPILRRVEPTSITVWLAFSKKQTTQLVIWGNGDEPADQTTIKTTPGSMAKSGLVETIEVAARLHIALITLDTSQTRLVETTAYSYNIYYGDSADALKNDLGTSVPNLLHEPTGTDHETFIPLGYKKGNLPTIVIPSEKLENLHIVHGSCRKINGIGDEAFRHLDTLLKTNRDRDKLEKRPQQLFLTGDQIYADEIPKIALPFVNALGRELFGDQKEQLVIKASSTKPETISADMEHFPPGCRQFLVNETAKFTGNGIESHLLAFQEYCSTYLHYWSPEVWSPELKLLLNKYKTSGYDDEVGSFHYYYLINIIKNFETGQMSALLFKADLPENTTKNINDISALQMILKSTPATVLTDSQNTIVAKWKSSYNAGDAIFPDFDNIVKMMQHVENLNENQKKVLSLFFSLESVIS